MSAVLEESAPGEVVGNRQGIPVQESRTPARTDSQPLDESTVLLQVIARAAQDPSIDLDRMERLMVMQERLSAKKAEREFTEAMARFQATAPKIIKDKRVHFGARNGGATTDYMHATLGGVCSAVLAGLGKEGISVSWVPEQKDKIYVTCILTHQAGHSTRTTLGGAPDNSGNKNALQQVSSAITYLERYTLLAATGMATHDQDDDGRGAGNGDLGYTPITAEQVEKLDKLLKETNGNKASFLRWAKISSLSEINSAAYEDCVRVIENKRQAK